MKAKIFNELKDVEKWVVFWNKRIKLNGTWHCKDCGEEDEDEPYRAPPFWGSSIHCEMCGGELTSRTGGGQNDPFNWILKDKL